MNSYAIEKDLPKSKMAKPSMTDLDVAVMGGRVLRAVLRKHEEITGLSTELIDLDIQ